jgi:hypothetical protein
MSPLRSTALAAAALSAVISADTRVRHCATSSLAQWTAMPRDCASRTRLAVRAAISGSRAQRSASARRSAMKTSSDLVFASRRAGRPCPRRSRSDRSTPTYIQADAAASTAQSASTIALCLRRLAMKRPRTREEYRVLAVVR